MILIAFWLLANGSTEISQRERPSPVRPFAINISATCHVTWHVTIATRARAQIARSRNRKMRHCSSRDMRGCACGEDSAQEKVKPNSRHNSHSLILRVNSDSWPTPLLWVNSSETTTRICEYGVVLLGYFSEIIVIRWLNIARG